MSSSPVLYNPTGANGGQGNILPPTLTGSSGSYGFGNSANPNPSQPSTQSNPFNAPSGGSANSTFAQPTNAIAQNPTGAPGSTATVQVPGQGGSLTTTNTFDQTASQQHSSLVELQNQLGQGFGSMVDQYLQSEGGYNSPLTEQTVDAQTALMNQQAAVGAGALKTNLAESGISPNSSVAALEMSNYQANVTTGENAITAQDFLSMYDQSQANELSEMQSLQGDRATTLANNNYDSSFMGIMGDIGSLGGLLGGGGASGSGGGLAGAAGELAGYLLM